MEQRDNTKHTFKLENLIKASKAARRQKQAVSHPACSAGSNLHF
jgi:hypothetical protein